MRKPPSWRASNLSELPEPRGVTQTVARWRMRPFPPATLRMTSVEPPYQIFSPTPSSFCNFLVRFNHYGNVRKVFADILLTEDGISRNNTPKVSGGQESTLAQHQSAACVSLPFMFHFIHSITPSDQHLACERHLFPASLFHPGFNVIKSVKEHGNDSRLLVTTGKLFLERLAVRSEHIDVPFPYSTALAF